MNVLDFYNANDFWGDLRNDIWMLKIIGELPEEPPTQISSSCDEKTGITAINVRFIAHFCMDAQREAVQAYRNQLVPIVFTLTQKVYAELFRLVLGQSPPHPSKKEKVKTQYHVGKQIEDNLTSLTVSPTFKDRNEFYDWWEGRYRYDHFRLARNQITHEAYNFDGRILLVKDEDGASLLKWTTNEVFDFAQCVLVKARHVSSMWAVKS